VNYSAFYTSRPFWAGARPDLKKHDVSDLFTDIMSEFVFKHDTDDFQLRVCRDGMIMLHVFKLESNLGDEHKPNIHDIVSQ